MLLPGIGETLAGRIVEYRQEHGPFSSVDDLLAIPGIGEGVVDRILAASGAAGGILRKTNFLRRFNRDYGTHRKDPGGLGREGAGGPTADDPQAAGTPPASTSQMGLWR